MIDGNWVGTSITCMITMTLFRGRGGSEGREVKNTNTLDDNVYIYMSYGSTRYLENKR